MKLNKEDSRELIQKFLSHPKFRNCLFPEEQVAIETGTYELLPNNTYLSVYEDGILKAIVRFEPATSISISHHLYVSPDYWGTSFSDRLSKELDAWYLKNTYAHKLIVHTPVKCTNVIQAAFRDGYELEGISPGAVFWKGEISDLVYLGRFIRRTQNG